jgi:hypothetical protein
MRKTLLPLLLAALLIAGKAFAAQPPALLAPATAGTQAIAHIPDGYFEPVALDGGALFALKAPSRHVLVLPHLGALAVVHDATRPVDSGGAVMRWEGHTAGRNPLKVSFVKGLSGSVSGVIDTPAGPVLLGQAGDYMVYKQSNAAPPDEDDALPQALLKRSPDQSAVTAKPAAVAYPVEFNAAAVAQVPINGEVMVSLPGAGEFRVMHDNDLAGDLGATTFVGYLKDFGDDFRMEVTYSPSGAQGRILTPYGLFLIKTVGTRQWLIDVGRSGLRPVTPVANDGVERLSEEASPAAAPVQTQTASTTRTAASRATTTDAATRIDVLVLYTTGLADAYGGIDQAQTEIQNLVALANQAYLDSGVNIVLHLVGAVEIDAPDNTLDSDVLNSLTNDRAPYDNVSSLRSTYGADLVSLVRPFSMGQGGICGNAWVAGANGSALSLYRNYSFSVVGDGQEGGYYCPGYSFVHELSHNMGSAHDRATVAEQNGSSGAFPYSYGYGVSGAFGTIMSYVGPQVGKFSSPLTTCGGQTACGIDASDPAAADNALSLNNARAAVAAFAPEAVAQGVSVAGVITVEGAALGGVRLDASPPAQCSASGTNGSFSCLMPSGWSGTITPVLAGYTFSPASLSLDNLSDNAANRNFTAARSGVTTAATNAAAVSSGSGGGGALGIGGLMVLALLSGALRVVRML